MSDFDALLQEMAEDEERLQKALENEDSELQDLADGEEEEQDEEDEDEEDEMGKSLSVTLENGEQVQALDGTALVKSLMAKQEKSSSNVEALASQTVSLLKSMSSTIDKQNTRIESLQKSLNELGAQGRGRKSKVTVQDRGNDSAPASVDAGEDVMQKAMKAFDDGKITGIELNTIDVGLRSRQAPPADLLAKIV